MRKQIFVKDIQKEFVEVNDCFIVVKKGVFSSKNNTKYISIGLRDKTGVIEGKIWDRVDEVNALFEKNDVVYVKSTMRLYQGKPQLTVTDIRKMAEELSPNDMKVFLPENEGGNENLAHEYFQLVDEIQNVHIRKLFSVLNSDQEMLEKYLLFPASVGVHHVYIGGLLEHSLSLAKMGKYAVDIMGGNRDIVIAGSLLHDIGKIEEIDIRGGFKYSDKGRLLGHITLGVMILDSFINKIEEFPADMAAVLKHITISHHGTEEWGSPRKPMCIEALMVHYFDNLDAKIAGVREHMRENMEDERWSTYHKLYESRFYKVQET